MYAIDIIINSKNYKTKQQIFDDFEQIAWDLNEDLQKIFLNAGGFIGENWIDFFCDAVSKNKKKLQKMENKLTFEFWNKNTNIKRALEIIQSMLRSEIQNAMDSKRGGKPLINQIKLFNFTQLDDLRRGDDTAMRFADAEIDLAKFDKKVLKNGLKKMAEDIIFEKDPQYLQEQIKYLCKKYGFDFKEIVPEEKEKFCQMLENGEIAKDECNQMYFVF